MGRKGKGPICKGHHGRTPGSKRFLPAPPLARLVAEVEFPRRVAFFFYLILFLAGIIFYLVWGFYYGAWNLFSADWIGAYAVTVILLGFGIVGMLLYKE